MSNVVSKNLSIDKNNVEQYCDAKNITLNVVDYAWRKWLNGSTDGYVILKPDGKAVLYPTDTARPFKADSMISAGRSAGSCGVDLQFGGVKVHAESYTSVSEKEKSKNDITDSAITNSTRSTEIKWHVSGSNINTQHGEKIELTLYFQQYAMSANAASGATGIKSVSVSNASPFYGDSVTFTAVVHGSATWHGWYSDAACTNLVSSELTYTINPSSDVTLYANATSAAELYSCIAVAGDEVSNATVSEPVVEGGENVTFTAQVNEGCIFDGWYADSGCTALVSTLNPYTQTITADTTLYAKATRKQLSMAVGSAEHGTASVSASTVPYGSNVTFTFTPADETWELYGWYSDPGLTQLVSESNPYTLTATRDVTLYPKVGAKRYTITFGRKVDLISGENFKINVIVVNFDQLTREEINCLRTGDYESIDKSKILASDSISGSNMLSALWKTIECPLGAYVAVYTPEESTLGFRDYSLVLDGNGEPLTYWPYYWFSPTADTTISSRSLSVTSWCDCSAVAKEGIAYAYATTPTLQEKDAIFEAELSPGYTFTGWYSDEACTKLVSAENPAKVTTPKYTGDTAAATFLALYAKATKVSDETGIYLKQNGVYKQANSIWKKTNGIWAKTDKTVFDTGKKYILS